MRVPERYWRIEAVASLLLAPFAFIGAISYLNAQLPLDQSLGHSPLPDFLLAVCVFMVYLGLSLVMAVLSKRARNRERRRQAAIHGDQDAVPFTFAIPYSDDAPNVAAEPLELLWPAGISPRPALARLQMAGGVIALALSWGLPVATLALLASNPQAQPLDFNVWTAALESIPGIFVGTSIMISCVAHTYGASARLVADSMGITWFPVLGRTRHLRWDEMRLLEVAGTQQSPQYLLFGEHEHIRWGGGFSYGERQYRFYALLDVVAARTGLAPRTFTQNLSLSTFTAPVSGDVPEQLAEVGR